MKDSKSQTLNRGLVVERNVRLVWCVLQLLSVPLLALRTLLAVETGLAVKHLCHVTAAGQGLTSSTVWVQTEEALLHCFRWSGSLKNELSQTQIPRLQDCRICKSHVRQMTAVYHINARNHVNPKLLWIVLHSCLHHYPWLFQFSKFSKICMEIKSNCLSKRFAHWFLVCTLKAHVIPEFIRYPSMYLSLNNTLSWISSFYLVEMSIGCFPIYKTWHEQKKQPVMLKHKCHESVSNMYSVFLSIFVKLKPAHVITLG